MTIPDQRKIPSLTTHPLARKIFEIVSVKHGWRFLSPYNEREVWGTLMTNLNIKSVSCAQKYLLNLLNEATAAEYDHYNGNLCCDYHPWGIHYPDANVCETPFVFNGDNWFVRDVEGDYIWQSGKQEFWKLLTPKEAEDFDKVDMIY